MKLSNFPQGHSSTSNKYIYTYNKCKKSCCFYNNFWGAPVAQPAPTKVGTKVVIVNKLSINVNKTNFILFTSPRKNHSSHTVADKILINDIPIKQVHSVKFLGVYLDKHLQWSDHVDAVIGKISKTCGILNKLKNRLPRHVLAIIYQSLILPYLQYCAIVWANCSSYMLDSVYIVQKRAIRIICDLPQGEPTQLPI